MKLIDFKENSKLPELLYNCIPLGPHPYNTYNILMMVTQLKPVSHSFTMNSSSYDVNSEVFHESRDLKIYQLLGTILYGHIYPYLLNMIYSHSASTKRS